MMGHSKREGFNDQLGPVAPVNLLFLTCFKSSALWDENGTSETKRLRVCTLVSGKHLRNVGVKMIQTCLNVYFFQKT